MWGEAQSSAEGWLSITLPATPGGGVAINRGGGLDVSALLRGKPAQTALQIVPTLFAVCEHAHREAATRALGHAPSPRLSLTTAMETLREHVLRIALDWAEFLGETTAPAAAREAIGLMQALRAGEDAETVADRAETLLVETVFAEPLAAWRAEDLATWAARHETLAARMISTLASRGWMNAGAAGTGRDATVFARRAEDPKLAGLGNGLGARMAARLVELAQLPEEMRGGMQALPHGAARERSTVAAARGPLRHDAELRDGVIERYRIVTPTEVNFAPGGPAERGLAALDHPDREIRLRQARWFVNAVDPCVRCEIGVADA